ncbi:hypothetical protein FOA52_003875 [Chlamydomonas sp. UWO 241]|nr:hypothetical protein FOA52_003875 [Chlamydomonas sp. UWO 241]
MRASAMSMSTRRRASCSSVAKPRVRVAPGPLRVPPCRVAQSDPPANSPVGFSEEVILLERALMMAKDRVQREAAESQATPAASASSTAAPTSAFTVKTFNAISPVGLTRFPPAKYAVSGEDNQLPSAPMSIMLRSHKLKEEEVPASVRCIVRCGAGTNNIPVERMTELGIPVFNTPGANANAVKELIVCGLLLASRGILEGNNHVNNVINVEEKMDYEKINKRIEKDKAKFVGNEIAGKTIGVVGLGAIGGLVVNAALALGMKIVGYDPALSMEAAWKLPGDRMIKAKSFEELLKVSDFITFHVPYIKNATHHMLNGEMLQLCKPGVHLLNFARREIIDGEALKDMWRGGRMTGKYISDFADPYLQGKPQHIVLPHLGASTAEAEDNSAAMAADTIQAFLEHGTIRHSVNFPQAELDAKKGASLRLCIVMKNCPNALGTLTSFLGEKRINIEQQLMTSRGDVGYTVIDFNSFGAMDSSDAHRGAAEFQAELGARVPLLISSRIIGYGPGNHFWNKRDDNAGNVIVRGA